MADWVQQDEPIVFQEVRHFEPAMQIDEEEARATAEEETNELWAQNVERRIAEERNASTLGLEPQDAEGTVGQAEQQQQRAPEQVFLLRIGGDNVTGLRQRLLTGPELGPCRNSMEAAGQEVQLPQEALVFVRPWQYEAVRQALLDQVLQYFHIIVSEGLEYLVQEALQVFPHRQRAKVKQQHRRALALGRGALEQAPAAAPEQH
jgi:hypothetical protein